MTLWVDSRDSDAAAFRDEVIKVLDRVCPCRRATIDPASGEVAFNPTPLDFRCYEKHRAGCNLLMDLVSVQGKVTITRTGQGNLYARNSARVWWDPDDLDGGRNVQGNTRRPTFVGLAHELVHALADHDTNENTRYGDEPRAVCGENQVRQAHGEPLRLGDDSGEHVSISMRQCTAWNLLLDRHSRERCHEPEAAAHRAPLRERGWWWLKQMRTNPKEPPRRLGRGIEFGTGGLSFDELADNQSGADTVLGQRMRASRATRDAAPQRIVLEQFAGAFDQADRAVLLEGVTIAGAYRVVLAMAGGPQQNLVTNLGHRPDHDFWIGPPGDLVEYQFATALKSDVANRLDQLAFAPRLAGNTEAVDGTVQFLTLKLGSNLMRAALYAYHYPGFDYKGFLDPGDPDYRQWLAVSETYALWRDLLLQGSRFVRVIARR